MKRVKLFILLVVFSTLAMFAQRAEFPNVKLTSVDGRVVNATEIGNTDKPLVLVFWNEESYSGYSQMVAINEIYEEFSIENNFELVSIYVDESGKGAQIRPMIAGNGWDFDVYVDKNGGLMHSLGISSTPYTLVYDDEMNLISRYSGHCDCATEMLEKSLTELNSESYVNNLSR